MRIEPTLQVENSERGESERPAADAPARFRHHDIYRPSTPLVLLYGATYLLSLIATATALRSVGQFSVQSIAGFAAGFLVVVVVSAWLRPLLRDVVADLSLRERAGIWLIPVAAFVAPTLFIPEWKLMHCLIALLASLHLVITEQRHFVRLISVQLFMMFVAQLTTIEDDLWGYSASLAAAALTAFAAYMLRMAFVMEKFELVFPISIRRIFGAVGPTFLALVFAALAVFFLSGTTQYANRPSIKLEQVGKDQLKLTTVEAHKSSQVAKYVADGVLAALCAFAFIWLVAQVRDRLAKRSQTDLALDLAVEVEEDGAQLSESRRRRPAPRDARQRLIAAYVDFCGATGRVLRKRRRYETPHEYEESLLRDDRLDQCKSDLDDITALFERARYSGAEITPDDARDFAEKTRGLTKWIARHTNDSTPEAEGDKAGN